MPNWIDNTLTVYGPAKEILRFKRRANGNDPLLTKKERAIKRPCVLEFNRFIPIPPEVLAKGDEGSATYYWQIANWGVKWGASLTGDPERAECYYTKRRPNIVTYWFNTPWDPPILFLRKVSKEWPQLTFMLDYILDGTLGFGIAKFKAGKRIRYEAEAG
jgi:hypothetical protein